MSDSNGRLNVWFDVLQGLDGIKASQASGANQQDYLYEPAESVRLSSTPGFVYVTYQGVEYGPCRITAGALEDFKAKSTVLVQIQTGEWYKLWFYSSSLTAQA